MTTQTVTLRLVAENGQLVGSLRSSRRELGNLGGSADQARGRMGQLGQESQRLSNQLGGLRTVALDLARGFAAGLGIGGLVATMTGGIGIAREYRKSLAEVSTLLTDTSGLQQYDAQVRGLAKTYGTAAAEQSRAIYQIISSGQQGAAAISTLDAANKLAIGGVTDITTAADGLTSVLNAYGDRVASARDVSDTLFVGMRQGKTTIGELSASLGLVAPIASTLGVEFDELVASIATITLGGVKTAEATTQVRQALAGVLKPTSEAVELAASLGLEFNAQALAAKGLSGFLADVADKTGGNQQAMSQLFGSVESVSAVFALTANGGATLNNIMDQMAERAGSTETAFGKMGEEGDFALNRMSAAAQDSLITLGDRFLTVIAPAALAVANNIEAITDAISTGTSIAAAYFALFVGAPAIVRGGAALASYTSNIVAQTYARQQELTVTAAGSAAFARMTQARVNDLQATTAAIAAVRVEQTARLSKTNVLIAEARATIAATQATGSAGAATGLLSRAEAQLTVAMKARSAATAELAMLGRQQAAVTTQLTAATAANTAAQTASASALTATGLAARATAAGVGVLRGALALVGGPAGAAVVAGVGIYYLSTMSTEAEKRARELRGGIDELRSSLANLNSEAAKQELYTVRDQIQEVAAALSDSDRRMSMNVRDFGADQNGFVAWATGMSGLKRESDELSKTLGELYKTEGQLVARMDDLAVQSQRGADAVGSVGDAAGGAAPQVNDLATQTKAAAAAADAAAKAWSDYQDTLSKRADAYDEALFSVQDEIDYQTELNRLLRSGVTEAEAEAQARRAMEPIQSNAINTERDRLAALQASNAAIVQGREAQAEASRKAQEQTRETAQASQRAAADINRSLTDALLRGFEDGQGFADNFFRTLKNTAATLVLRPVIEFALKPLSSVLGSIAGGGGGGLLSSLTGGGGGGLGQLASLFGGGVSLAQGATLGFQGGGVLGAAQGFADAALTNLGEGIANLGARFGSASAQSFGSSISASAGSLGNVLGAAGLGYLGGSTVGGLLGLSGDGQTGAGIGGALGAGIGSIVPGLGTLLGGAIGTALGGLVGSTFGGSGWKTDDVRLSGEFTGADFDGSLMQYNSKKRSLGRSTRRRNTELDATEFEDALSDLFGNVFAVGTDAAERLGLSVSDFTYRIDESIMGLEGDALAEKLIEIVSAASDAWAEQTLPGLERYRLEGESSAETFFRVAGAAAQMQDSLARVNQTMNVTGQDLVMVSQILLDQFGGSLEAFEAATAGFFDRFYDDAEKFRRDRQTLDDAFGGIDISGRSFELPDTREGFREFVEGINLTLETGAEAYAVLTRLSDVADRYYATLEAREADRAELLGDINGRIDELTMSAQALDLQRLDREFDALRERADELDLDSTVIDQLYALERAAREAGATVDELARQRSAFDSDIAGRLARQGLQGRDLESFDLEAEYSAAIAEAQRLGADLTAVETYFQGERNRIAQSAADEALEIERAAAAEAARQAQAIASERAGLLRELYQVEGNTAALRAMERDALDASNQPLYDRIQALRDSATAEAEATRATEARTQAAAQAVESARRNAVAAYDAEISRLQGIVGAVADARSRVDAARSNAVSIYERQRSALQATAEEFRGLAAGIADFRTGLRAELAGPQAAAASAQRAFADVARRARLGDRSALAELPSAGNTARESALANAPTRQDYLDQLGAIDAAAAEAESVAVRQASIADRQLAQLDATASRLGLLNEQMETLDGAVRTLQSAEAALAAAEIAAEQAEMQIEELIAARDGISQVNTSVLSVGAAVSQLAVAQAQYAASVAAGFGNVQSQIAALQSQAIPQFAGGGDHTGGWLMAGERGREIIATGPARVFTAEQTRAILSPGGGGGGSNAELVALLREIAQQNAQILNLLVRLSQNSDRVEAIVEEWDAEGLPEERAA